MLLLAIFLALSIFIPHSTAHLDLSPEELDGYHANIKRDSKALSQCLQSPGMQDHNAHMLAHRDNTLRRLRKVRGLGLDDGLLKRNNNVRNKWAAINHEQAPGHSRDPQDLFDFRWGDQPKYNNTGCALTPASTEGPFWHYFATERQDIRAGQRGIYLRLAMQVIYVATCKPLHGARIDVWKANAMGQYSDNADGYLRGWQPTSYQGTVDFDTNFPGHYPGRASHIHVIVRAVNERRVVSFGMIYFDQNIRNAVEATARYKGSIIPLVSNLEDEWIPVDSSSNYDPFVRWSRIGKSLEDGGLLAWITLGFNTIAGRVSQPPGKKRHAMDWHLR
ncbi:aromatic compound dioxygenase [Setomelanomma holmii]|uniref:Aromatic compound dioxygenase n=1 Tax=Setomelanomma holmii TaxID=210430 RepID=A0A9P4LF68_9PLEO|nr:aromatic compound dioxygenase [Setomelanomma holmii]